MDFEFVTPANNIFPIEPSSVSKNVYDENLLEFISTLKDQNTLRKKECIAEGALPFQSTPTRVVEIVFSICALFELPKEVKFLAIDIFDRFVINHTTDVWQYSCESSADLSSQRKYWRRVAERSQKQALLRVLSSIQIASKFVLQSAALSPKHIEEYLSKWGHAFNLRSICRSETRLFSTLGCKVPIYSIFDYITVLLEALEKWMDETSELFLVCDQVLEYMYLQRDEIYKRFFWMATNRWEHSREERMKFADAELDRFLMASSIIVSSIYILNLKCIGPNKASEILSELANVSSNDIRGLSIITSQLILGSGTRTVSFRSFD
ncbi:uncharacterized protein LOC113204941 [Frankliniella occidentalis]|uniref:Uncharacterized protein LOC113204941 n=1 Tax=Frankliniella occidentalis TaxID=133901 RepID=A0A6J1S4H2_FRAOC|nr:uncharacterized protein LOC113204941 [Frankliniella occidentalis]